MKSENGNVLFIIFITIVLFAALSYAVTQSTRGTINADRERSYVLASQFADYGNALSTVIKKKTMISRCDRSQLNFETPDLAHPDFWGGSENTIAPANGSCDVFGEGGAHYWDARELPADGVLEFTTSVGVEGIGTASSDLIMYLLLPDTAQNRIICDTYNRLADNSGNLESGSTRTLDWEFARGAGLTFTDTTDDIKTIGEDSASSGFAGKKTGCLTGASTHDSYTKIMYYVLGAY